MTVSVFTTFTPAATLWKSIKKMLMQLDRPKNGTSTGVHTIGAPKPCSAISVSFLCNTLSHNLRRGSTIALTDNLPYLLRNAGETTDFVYKYRARSLQKRPHSTMNKKVLRESSGNKPTAGCQIIQIHRSHPSYRWNQEY